MAMYIVGMNGPPRAGKDTIAKMLALHVESKHDTPVLIMPLSMPMRLMAFAAIGQTYSIEKYEEYKDMNWSVFDGKTMRQFMIALSEDFMKPKYGQQVWSKAHWLRIKNFVGLVIVTDFGFHHEPAYLEQQVGQYNTVTVNVTRHGKTFDGDSRSYVYGLQNTHVDNNGNLNDAETEAIRIYGRLLNQFGWKFS